MIEYEVRLARAGFFLGEEVTASLQLTNGSPDAIELQDPAARAATEPVHHLVGPGHEDGVTFTNHGSGEAATETGSPEAPRISVPAGGKRFGSFVLNRVADLGRTGEYVLSSSIELEGKRVQSSDVQFSIEALNLQSVAVGQGLLPFDQAEGEVAFIHSGSGGGRLYTFGFREVVPAMGETSEDDAIFRLAVGEDATDLTLPWRNSPYFDETLSWVVWREGRVIRALHSIAEAPLDVELPHETQGLVRPAIKTRGGPVEVLALAADGGQLSLVRVTADPTSGAPSGNVAWTVDLPTQGGEIVGSAAALAPVALASGRRVVVVVQREDGLEVLHAGYEDGGAPNAFERASLPGRFLAGSQIASFVDPEGVTHVSLLSTEAVADADSLRRCVVTEVAFSPEGRVDQPRELVRYDAGDAGPSGGAVVYVGTGAALVRRDGILADTDGALRAWRDSGSLVSITPPGEPVVPLLLAPGKNTSYVLVRGASGLHFESL